MTASPVALVTGAASGMGQLSVWRLASVGWQVAAVDVNHTGLTETAKEYPDLIRAFNVDVTDGGALNDAVATATAELGPVERVVAAAGMSWTGRLLDNDTTDILRVMDVNYGGMVRTVAATLPGMLSRGHGQVVLFSSGASFTPQIKLGSYSASKCAVTGYAETLWRENRGRGVTIVCVCPSAVRTPMEQQLFRDPAKRKKNMAVTPGFVLDAVDRALKTDRFLVLPGAPTKTVYLLRRISPSLLRWVTSQRRFDLID